MITNLRDVTKNRAVADGQKYDFDKVLDAAMAFVKRFVAQAGAPDPGCQPIVRLSVEEERLLDEAGYALIERFFRTRHTFYDVCGDSVSVIVGAYWIRLHVLGQDHLYMLPGRSEPAMGMGEAWQDLDPEPLIRILPPPATGELVFKDEDKEAVVGLVRHCAPPGTAATMDAGAIPTLRFPVERFGRKKGSLRVLICGAPTDLTA